MNQVLESLRRKFGPLPAWAWLSLFAVGMIVWRSRKTAGNAVVSPSQVSSGPSVVIPTQGPSIVFPASVPPTPALPVPGGLSKKETGFWDRLLSWWYAGSSGAPPELTAKESRKLSDVERQIYSQQLAYYESHPYSPGSQSGPGNVTINFRDPTTDTYYSDYGDGGGY